MTRTPLPSFLTAVAALAVTATAHAQFCEPCLQVVDAYCDRSPQIVDAGYTPPVRGVAETRAPNPAIGNVCVTLYDVAGLWTEDTNLTPITRYHGPANSWNVANLGTVFGLTMDQHGNMYVCHTSCYASDAVGPAGAGAIHRIDGSTGAITTFATLPNASDPNLTAPNDKPGLGNISYDCEHDQFFVTDLEDGKIYRIKSSNPLNGSPAAVLDFFDPLGPDDGLPGFAPLGERLWGVQWHTGRVYYGVWATDFGAAPSTNTVRSVALDAGGAFDWASDRHEVALPAHSLGKSGPISDISFGPFGKMLVAERTMIGPTTPGAHQARVYEFPCTEGSTSNYSIGVAAQTEAAGGVDYDWMAYNGPQPPETAPPGTGASNGRTWVTGDALHAGAPYPDAISGLQGLRPTGGSITTSLLIDSDGSIATNEEGTLGDVEIASPGVPVGVGDRPNPASGARDLVWVTPMPWRGSGDIHIVTVRPGLASATIFDVRGGALRRVMEPRWLPAGRHDMPFDGLGRDGQPLPAGVYLIRVSLSGAVTTGRFVLVR